MNNNLDLRIITFTDSRSGQIKIIDNLNRSDLSMVFTILRGRITRNIGSIMLAIIREEFIR